MNGLSDTFWFLWLATGVLCFWGIWKAWRNPNEFLGLPVAACSMWLYFYVYLAWNAATKLIPSEMDDLPVWIWEVGQLTALLSLFGLLKGWDIGRARMTRAAGQPSPPDYSYSVLWNIGVACLILGSAAFYLFKGQDTIDWEHSSAYWYLLFHIGYPGAAICVFVMTRSARHRSWISRLFFGALILIAMYPHVASARRGPLYPMVVALLYTAPLAARQKPKRLVILLGLAASGLIMLFFVEARVYVYRGRGWDDAFKGTTLDRVVTSKATTVADNEFVYHCWMVATNCETNLYQYGTGYLSLAAHWVPRQLWPDKPRLGQGFFPAASEQVAQVIGRKMTPGASVAGAAEAFNQFGWGALLWWFAIGFVAARMYSRGKSADDARWQIGFVGFMSALHWLISQGFADAFVPAMIYQCVPLLAFALARQRRPHRAAPPERALVWRISERSPEHTQTMAHG
jgi:hypothetical protein